MEFLQTGSGMNLEILIHRTFSRASQKHLVFNSKEGGGIKHVKKLETPHKNDIVQ